MSSISRFCKAIARIAVIAMVLAVTAPTAFAMAPLYVGTHNFAIPTGSTTWSGKPNAMWNFNSTAIATWSVNPNKSVQAELYYVREYLPDYREAYFTAGPSGNSTKFSPKTNVSYYAVITRSQEDGASGTTSTRQ